MPLDKKDNKRRVPNFNATQLPAKEKHTPKKKKVFEDDDFVVERMGNKIIVSFFKDLHYKGEARLSLGENGIEFVEI